MGLHVVIPLHRYSILSGSINFSPPRTFSHRPTWQTRPAGSHPRSPQPLRCLDLRHNFRWHPPLLRSRDPRNPMVLAPLKNPFSMVPLFSTRDPPVGSGLLLVLHILPLSIRPHGSHILRHPTTP
ncbi:hypothetical protein HS088_TW13G01074 [Tripterygium wilfordii]|uniref:Uncharacterized protein n=1 Tax=Tripterygium wilfordii TaxID=458696 RepID=A0A7J7CW66_TRIWF|nr:hypothetical protein HS088_TW13G01074 [Tripterygium wilfordii]